MRKIWDDISMKGKLKFSEKLRVWWLIISFVLLGSLTFEAPFWIVVVMAASLFGAIYSLRNVKFDKFDDDDDE
jgi:hypothetical protein